MSSTVPAHIDLEIEVIWHFLAGRAILVSFPDGVLRLVYERTAPGHEFVGF